MHHADEAVFISTGDKAIDIGLIKICKKIDNWETFGAADDRFVKTLLQKKLSCEHCRSVLLCLYLHLRYGRRGTLENAEWSIFLELTKHKKALHIPDMQAIPTGEDNH